MSKKSELSLSLSLVNPGIGILAADPENKLILKAEVRDSSGMPVQYARILLTSDNDFGSLYPEDVRTNTFGEAIVTYSPPEYDSKNFSDGYAEAVIRASIDDTDISEAVKVKITRTPVVMIHGYQSNGDIFENLMGYLNSKGYECIPFNYDSIKGIAHGSGELKDFLQQQKLVYLSKGIQVGRFDLIAHSMGGLVARYYTCSREYIKNHDIKKIIFISVPHKGSPIASLGAEYFEGQGILDLIPDNPLFTHILPSMINKGLNNTIQTGNIIAQYDEVVGITNASLDEWGIKTELFNLGKSNITVDDILNGTLVQAPIHKGILSNKKVFEKILFMLENELPYPKLIRGS
ncbi:esterase/lipase family protein [Clostridium thermosuccinogenes]|uniref:esterase/lipase family protein n=1 Tax=Clostridium thermosuccinogenes TaxID=84032 RepID=UPI00137B152C|nr:alpha/beta fold hydrolase [Pseudoclostridium thermosuccinogenes]